MINGERTIEIDLISFYLGMSETSLKRGDGKSVQGPNGLVAHK